MAEPPAHGAEARSQARRIVAAQRHPRRRTAHKHVPSSPPSRRRRNVATSTSSRTLSSMAARSTLSTATSRPAATKPMPPGRHGHATDHGRCAREQDKAGTTSSRPGDRANGIGAIAADWSRRLMPSR